MSEAESDANSADRLQLSLPSWTMSALGWLLCACAVLMAIFVGLKLNERYGWLANGKHNCNTLRVVFAIGKPAIAFIELETDKNGHKYCACA